MVASPNGERIYVSSEAVISVNLAVVNLLPIPVLDGGAFLILAAEGIMRRPLPVKVRDWWTYGVGTYIGVAKMNVT